MKMWHWDRDELIMTIKSGLPLIEGAFTGNIIFSSKCMYNIDSRYVFTKDVEDLIQYAKVLTNDHVD